MPAVTPLIFGVVYLGLFMGGLPVLRLDRTGVALLGAIALLASGSMSLAAAVGAVHVPTLSLLFAFMIVSAQLRLGGFYVRVADVVGALPLRAPIVLALMMSTAALLSAVFSNDVVCLAMAPVLVDICRVRSLHSTPFLIGLACAANIGSAATLIGNPQNMLIGQTLALSFGTYLRQAAGPVLLSLLLSWLVLLLAYRQRWHIAERLAIAYHAHHVFSRWQSVKGLAVAGFLFAGFLASDWPHDLMALAGAGVLLLSRRLHSRDMLGQVDWLLLVLFTSLFVINRALQETGLPAQAVAFLVARGLDPHAAGPLMVASVLLSNLISNVPAVMLLLPLTEGQAGGTRLALSSTLAGNLILMGSIANLIVAEVAARHGEPIGWTAHARIGIPVTLSSLAVMMFFLA